MTWITLEKQRYYKYTRGKLLANGYHCKEFNFFVAFPHLITEFRPIFENYAVSRPTHACTSFVISLAGFNISLSNYIYTGCPIYGEPLKHLAAYEKFGQYDYVPSVTLNVYVKVIEITPC